MTVSMTISMAVVSGLSRPLAVVMTVSSMTVSMTISMAVVSGLKVWFGRILHSRDQGEAQVGEDRVDGVGDDGRRAVNTSLNTLGTSPPCSPSSSLDGSNRKNGGHAQAHLHWLVAGYILRSHRHCGSVEVQANSALS